MSTANTSLSSSVISQTSSLRVRYCLTKWFEELMQVLVLYVYWERGFTFTYISPLTCFTILPHKNLYEHRKWLVWKRNELLGYTRLSWYKAYILNILSWDKWVWMCSSFPMPHNFSNMALPCIHILHQINTLSLTTW